ncbi:hypothetical protein BS47DRAFT_1380914 [Hydnum rufescens UP504]|uniref:Uncharacterized protein n=1 Tax=Hydnum rufescens UP504 TaxID=1448309 RepID=A0A9P6DWS1_9AGAM|nr:hypothetical protein BS47DRAFT_1380914 [Hydnum rufescens UP504]
MDDTCAMDTEDKYLRSGARATAVLKHRVGPVFLEFLVPDTRRKQWNFTMKVYTKTGEDYDPKNEWYKFDDDKVSIVNKETILNLDGGGEDSTAYILQQFAGLIIVLRVVQNSMLPFKQGMTLEPAYSCGLAAPNWLGWGGLAKLGI